MTTPLATPSPLENAPTPPEERDGTFRLRDLFVALRPSQWTKNAVLMAAFFFAFWDRSQSLDLQSGLAIMPGVLLFCLISSGIYIINDLRDIVADRNHPVKRFRPIAAGRLPLPAARISAAVLLIGSMVCACLLSRPFALVAAIYILLQVVYSLGLKRVALIDILMIASGFVLRAIAGAVLLNVTISSWLLLCTFMLALFLALCKRRHELMLLGAESAEHRRSLGQYDRHLLDQLIGIAASATIVSYAIYTLWPSTVAKFGAAHLEYTIPFVIFGVFRYLDLAYRHEQGGRPEKVLLTDLPLLGNIGLYTLTLVLLFALSN